jgi:hypothetical protein
MQGGPPLMGSSSNTSFKKELTFRRTYHGMADDDLVIKNLREKCVNNNVRKMG